MKPPSKKIEVLTLCLDWPYIDRRVLLFAKTLQDSGCKVRILSLDAKQENGFEDIEIINVLPHSNGKRLSYLKVKKSIKNIAPPLLLKITRYIYRNFLKRRGYTPFFDLMLQKANDIKADIYIANDLPTLPIGYEAKKRNGGLLIYDAHEFYTQQKFLSRKEVVYFQEMEERLIKQADSVITVNQDIADIFCKTYGLTNVEIIFNATRRGMHSKNYLHDIINIDRSKKVVLYQGAFSLNRNLEKLIRIASFLGDSVMVMLGWGEMERTLKKMAVKYGILNKKIFFVPKISQAELISYTASASLGVIPYPAVDVNTTFCTPNKLFEFISAKVPIMANGELITVKNILNTYNIGITTNFNDEKFTANKIEEIVSDSKMLAFFSKNIEIAEMELNWEQEGRKVIDVIWNSLNKRECKNQNRG